MPTYSCCKVSIPPFTLATTSRASSIQLICAHIWNAMFANCFK